LEKLPEYFCGWKVKNGAGVLFVDGEHTITIRAFDGEDYSDEFSISIIIGDVGDEILSPWLIFALVLIVAIVVIVLALIIGRFSKKKESSYQHPQQIQYSEEVQTEGQSPGTRWSW